MNVTLIRWAQHSQTLGRMRAGALSWPTIERPATGEHPCIPAGTYALKLSTYIKGGYPAYEVMGVAGRSRILIHAANKASELLGCIAPGQYIADFDGEIGVAMSKAALAEFMTQLQGATDATLTITEAW